MSNNYVRFYSFLALLIIFVKYSESCSCPAKHPQTNFAEAQFVVALTVKSKVGRVNELDSYAVKVDKVFKSEVRKVKKGSLSLYSPYMCTWDLNPGEKYIISGKIKDFKATFTACDIFIDEMDFDEAVENFQLIAQTGKLCKVREMINVDAKATKKECILSPDPKHFECQERHSVCAPTKGVCSWTQSKEYEDCIRRIDKNI